MDNEQLKENQRKGMDGEIEMLNLEKFGDFDQIGG